MAGLRPGHPRLLPHIKTWMPGTRPGMTSYTELSPSNLFFGHFIVEFEHHAVGIGDENLPHGDARHLPDVERQILRFEPLFHPGKPAARKGDMMYDARIGLLLLVRL